MSRPRPPALPLRAVVPGTLEWDIVDFEADDLIHAARVAGVLGDDGDASACVHHGVRDELGDDHQRVILKWMRASVGGQPGGEEVTRLAWGRERGLEHDSQRQRISDHRPSSSRRPEPPQT